MTVFAGWFFFAFILLCYQTECIQSHSNLHFHIRQMIWKSNLNMIMKWATRFARLFMCAHVSFFRHTAMNVEIIFAFKRCMFMAAFVIRFVNSHFAIFNSMKKKIRTKYTTQKCCKCRQINSLNNVFFLLCYGSPIKLPPDAHHGNDLDRLICMQKFNSILNWHIFLELFSLVRCACMRTFYFSSPFKYNSQYLCNIVAFLFYWLFILYDFACAIFDLSCAQTQLNIYIFHSFRLYLNKRFYFISIERFIATALEQIIRKCWFAIQVFSFLLSIAISFITQRNF